MDKPKPKLPPGMEMAEEKIEEVLNECGIYDEETLKKAKNKIIASVMIGLLLDSFQSK